MADPAPIDSGVSHRSVVVAATIAVVLCGGFQLLFGDVDLNLRDEGYLWYGVKAVLAGDVPLRDFQAYDPGRYYYCAALAPVFGSGIVGVRASVALFETLGIFCGLLVVRRLVRGDAWLVPAGLMLVLWMFPRHKLFEPSITLIAVWVATRLLERPTVRRHLLAGVTVGLAAVFGRNHGLYLALSFLAVLGFLRWKSPGSVGPRKLAAWCAAVIAGYAPMLVMLAFVQGFASGFFDAVLAVAERGANIPVAYRWPWSAPHERFPGALALDVAYLLPVVLLPLGLVAAARTNAVNLRARAPLVAAALVGTVYVHHYWVRGDLPHLAQAIPPVLLCAIALPVARGAGRRVLAAVVGALLVLSLLVAYEGNTPLKPFGPGAPGVTRVAVEVAGDELQLKRAYGAAEVRGVQRVIETLLDPDEALFIAPTMPTYYPVLGRLSPVWWIYFLWPLTDAEQQAIVERLRERHVNWALVIQKPFNRDPAYNLDRTNPLLWNHLSTEWDTVTHELLPPRYFLFHRR